MSGNTSVIKPHVAAITDAFPVFRYAAGSAIIMVVVMSAGYTLAYITPVLALTFLSPGAKPPTLKSGITFIFIISIASLAGFLFTRLFIEFPLVFLPLLALIIFHLYYTTSLQHMKMWLILSLLLIPIVSMQSDKLGGIVAMNLVMNALLAMIMVGLVYFIFPAQGLAGTDKKIQPIPPLSDRQRYISAGIRILIVLPVLVLFFVFQWTESLLVLIFIAILSMNPASNMRKSGIGIIIANISGGLAAILVFNLLVIVPNVLFFGLLTLLSGLYFGNKLFSQKPIAPLYGMAFSTFLLVLGSVTSSAEGEAGETVWQRILQIGLAVIYIVVGFGLVDHLSRSKRVKNLSINADQHEIH